MPGILQIRTCPEKNVVRNDFYKHLNIFNQNIYLNFFQVKLGRPDHAYLGHF